MDLDKIIVTVGSLIGVAFTFWFFLMKKEKKVAAVKSGEIDILVNGGYTPEAISILRGKTTKLNFLRKDESSCLEEVVIPDFRIRKHLPLNQKVTIAITPEKAGEFKFSCGMNMFHGKIIVE